MQAIVLGKVYPIKSIVILIMETEPCLKQENLSEIMIYVGTCSQKRDQILKKITNGNLSVFEGLEDILQDWLLRRSLEANVENFLEYLKKCKLNSYAEAIENAFKQQTLVNREPKHNLADDINQPIGSPIHPFTDVESNNIPLLKTPSKTDVSGKPKSVIAKILFLSFMVTFIFGMVVFVDLQETTLPGNKLSDYDNTKTTLHTPIKYLKKSSKNSSSLGRCTSNGTLTKIQVHSYRDIEGQLSEFDKHCHQFYFDITSSAANDWPLLSTILDDLVINEVSIAGEMTVNKIIGILKHTKNLEKLHFDNKLGQLCNINNNATSFFEEIPQCRTALPKLAYLKMSSFATCDTLVTMLLTCVKMQPEKIDFDGKIDDENVQQISELLKSFLRTLTDLKITGTFDTQVSVIPSGYDPNQVKQISIEILNRDVRTYGKDLTDSSFCASFPLLHILRLKGVYFDLKDIQLLQTCKAIQELSIGIDVRETDLKKINYSYFQEQFPVLTSLEVYLAFTSCPSPDILTNFANEFGKIKSLTICSNCIVSNNRNSKCHRKMLAHIK